jgi:hypothetical protein
MPSISTTPIRLHASSILATLPDINRLPDFVNWHQLSVTHSDRSDSWFDSVGSLFNYELNAFDRFTKDFSILNQHFVGTYMEKVINQVNAQAVLDGVNIGRVRFMFLQPKTCYTLHIDPEEFRYHIPLVTNQKCFFVNNDIIERMPHIGWLYRFRTTEYHTAVNASMHTRIHLVFDTY